MSVLDSIKGFFLGPEEEEEEYQPIYEETAETVDVTEERKNREVKINTTATVQIVLARPADFSEVRSIGDDLKRQKTVLLNLEQVKNDDARRIMDFLSGVAYSIDGSLKKIATNAYVITPSNVDVGDAKLTRKAAPAPQAEEAVEETAEEFGNY